jgi:eukaryotic-like serine/threonine-protein kinase
MIGHLVGNYKVTDKIGEGGMGSVFRGIDIMLEREVAIKMLRPELSRQPHVVERFRSEAVTLAKLNHPNIATLYSFLRQGEDFFMVMEYVRGETIESLISKMGAMPCDRAVALFCQALEGIDHAHKMGIVHRDIKPANMMLTEAGSIKVMDFGIARVLGTDRLTKTGHLIGTVEYMSPEQVRGEETDARSDIYSLGILLYEMLTGRVPFNSQSEYELMRSHIEEAPMPPRTLVPQLPVIVEQAIMRALAKRPEARQKSANEFRMMLPQMDRDEVTRPDIAPTRPASYVTRLSEPPIDGALAGQVVKETRLADSGIPPTAYAGEIRETRLAADAPAQAAYQQMPPQYVGAAQTRAAGLPALLVGLMAKLNWKHYAGAGAILLALISLPFVLSGSGDKSTPTQPAAVAQPSRTLPPAPAQDAVSNPNQPVIPSASSASPAPVATDPQGDAARSSPGSKSTRPAGSGGGTTASQGGSRANTQGRSSSQARENAADRRSESNKKDIGKKTKTERVAEAAGAVGGVIRGIGGLLNKKKKN